MVHHNDVLRQTCLSSALIISKIYNEIGDYFPRPRVPDSKNRHYVARRFDATETTIRLD